MTPATGSPATTETTTVQCEHCGRWNRIPVASSGTPRCGNCHSALPWIVNAGDDTFADVAEHADLIVLVDMWAPWCGPCRMVSPALETVARENAGTLKLVKVNVDEARHLARRFSVQAVPTLLLLRNGEVVSRQAGAAPVDTLRRWVKDSLATAGGSS